MIPIQKNKESESLKIYKQENSTVSYSDGLPTDVNIELRKSLCEEQGYLCAYCMNRIVPRQVNGVAGMRIEHWLPQSIDEYHSLDYQNMLGVCCGEYPNSYTCDNFRGKCNFGNNGSLKYNPADKNDAAKMKIAYTASGMIKSEDEEFNKQLNNSLNLNCDVLKQNRLAIISNVFSSFEKLSRKKNLTPDNLKKILNNWTKKDSKGMLTPFCGVAVYFIQKRMKR